jgi:murein DD-endopeptidase MepM/ murein hydrolase activator NlpD
VIVDIQKLAEIKVLFTDLGLAVSRLSSENKDSFAEISMGISRLQRGFNSVLPKQSLKKLAETANLVSENVLKSFSEIQTDKFEASGLSKNSFVNDLTGLKGKIEAIKEAQAQEISKKQSKGVKKEKTAEEKEEDKDKRTRIYGKSVIDQVASWATKLKIPLPGNIMGGLVGIMAYGVMDSQRVKAEAGELTNILVTAFDGTVKKLVNSATSKMSAMQEVLQKFYGVSRKEYQASADALIKGGNAIEDISRTADASLGMVGKDYTMFALGVDKMFEVAGGTTSKRMVEYMQQYGGSLKDAKEYAQDLMFTGVKSGIGWENFVKSVESTSQALQTMGFRVEDVIKVSDKLRIQYEKMGVPKQLAGRYAAKSMGEMAAGLANMADSWKLILSEKLGFGSGISGYLKFQDSLTRVMKGGDSKELERTIVSITDVVIKMFEGDRDKARFALQKELGFGQEGARSAMMINEAVKKGDFTSAAKEVASLKKELAKSIETEAEKTSKFQLAMNEWMKGIAKIGNGMLGLILVFIAQAVAFFRSVPAFFNAIAHGDEKELTRLSDNIRDIGAPKDALIKEMEDGFALLKDAGGKMVGEIMKGVTDSLDRAFNFDPFPKSVQTKIPKLPPIVSKEASNMKFLEPARDQSPPENVFGTTPKRDEQERQQGAYDYGQERVERSLSLSSKGVTAEGDIVFELVDNTDDADSETTEQSDDTAAIVDEGSIGGRFRYQSLRPNAPVGRSHSGIDIMAKKGTAIKAPEGGKVIHVGDAKGAGKNIQIQHPSGETSWWMHMNDISEGLKPGSIIKKGQNIGSVGSTTGGGKEKTSPHIHLEVLKPGVSTEAAPKTPTSGQKNFHLREDPEQWLSTVGAKSIGQKG